MRVVFLGDSLTEARPGVSFVKKLEEQFPNAELVNYGKGGDTVKSLFKRVKSLNFGESTGLVVLWVGVNDIYQRLNWRYRLLNMLLRRPIAKDPDEFEQTYQALLHYLTEHVRPLCGVIAVSAHILGENEDNQWNRQLKELTCAIKRVASLDPQVRFVDAQKRFFKDLKDKRTTDFVPQSLSLLMDDVRKLQTEELIDERARERGLYVTLDGVHLNTLGAKIIAELLSEAIIDCLG